MIIIIEVVILILGIISDLCSSEPDEN